MSILTGFAKQVVADLTAKEKAAAAEKLEKMRQKRLDATAKATAEYRRKQLELDKRKLDQAQKKEDRRLDREKEQDAMKRLEPFLEQMKQGQGDRFFPQVSKTLDASMVGGEFETPKSMPIQVDSRKGINLNLAKMALEAGLSPEVMQQWDKVREINLNKNLADNMGEYLKEFKYPPDMLDKNDPKLKAYAKQMGVSAGQFIHQYTRQYNRNASQKIKLPEGHSSLAIIDPKLHSVLMTEDPFKFSNITIAPVRSSDGTRVTPVGPADLTNDALTRNADAGISFLTAAESLFMAGKGKTAMSHNGFKRTLLSVYDWFSKNDVQHSATGSRILGKHVLKKLSAINEYFSASNDNEIADKAVVTIPDNDISQNNSNPDLEKGWFDDKVIHSFYMAQGFDRYVNNSKDKARIKGIIQKARDINFETDTEYGRKIVSSFVQEVRNFSEQSRGDNITEADVIKDVSAAMIYNYNIQDQNHQLKAIDDKYTNAELKERRKQQSGIRKGLVDLGQAIRILSSATVKDNKYVGIDLGSSAAGVFAGLHELAINAQTSVKFLYDRFTNNLKDINGKKISAKDIEKIGNGNLKEELERHTQESLQKIKQGLVRKNNNLLSEDEYQTIKKLELLKVKIAYQMAGVFQGGTSGSRTISDQDYSIISKALWATTSEGTLTNLKLLRNTLTQGLMENEIALQIGKRTGSARHMERFVQTMFAQDWNNPTQTYKGTASEKREIRKVESKIYLGEKTPSITNSEFRETLSDPAMQAHFNKNNLSGATLPENAQIVRDQAKQYTEKFVRLMDRFHSIFLSSEKTQTPLPMNEKEYEKNVSKYYNRMKAERDSSGRYGVITEMINDTSLYPDVWYEGEETGEPFKFNVFKTTLFSQIPFFENFSGFENEKFLVNPATNFGKINSHQIDVSQMAGLVKSFYKLGVIRDNETFNFNYLGGNEGQSGIQFKDLMKFIDRFMFETEEIPYWNKESVFSESGITSQ